MLIKSADDKSSRLKLLEDLKQQPLSRQQGEWLEKELWALRTGIQGEKDAAYYINSEYKDSDHYAILHDLRIEVDGETAQIDHLLIGHHFAFLLETKNFNGNIDINERGEFSVKYATGRARGIPSPLEQSRRHERIFSKLLDILNIRNSSTNEKIKIRHIVLMSPNSIIRRPDSGKFDTSNIIKADALRQWREEFKSKEVLKVATIVPFVAKALLRPKNWISDPGPEVVRAYGERIAGCHKPADLLTLPDFMQLKSPAEQASQPAASQQPKTPPACATCGKAVSLAEARFCRIHKERFGGRLYCREHQQAFPHIRKHGQADVPAPAEGADICCAEPGCNKVLSAAVAAYCAEHADRFGGKFYCMAHQKGKKSRPSESQTENKTAG